MPMTKRMKTMVLAPTMMLCSVGLAQAQQPAGGILEEIVVTANKREENLQRVPVAVTALSAETIERAGIKKVSDFIALTPNVMLRDSFRAGEVFITVRGITTAQNGWSPVTYTVDGVQATSLDAINQGVLTDIERIEVLKGPQGVLYGAGAIAGAINVITKKPTEQTEYSAKVSYGNGEDFRASAAVSGPIVEDKVLFRLGGYYRDFGGLVEDTDGHALDFDEIGKLSGRLLFNLDTVSLDLTASYADARSGAATQQKLPDQALRDVFNEQTRPSRGLRSAEDRSYKDASARLDWDMGFATLTSVSGYSKIEQVLHGTFSWGKPPTSSLFGPVGGPNDPFADAFQHTLNNYESFSQDVRLASRTDAPLRWLIGAAYVDREAVDFLGGGGVLASGQQLYLLMRPDLRNDEAWGVYGEVNYDVTDQLTLTAGTRYDRNDYDSTQYTDLTLQTPVPTFDGLLTQRSRDSKWQPKLVATYQWTDDILSYVSYTEGFRFGFYSAGGPTAPESVKNYEVGLKTTLLEGRLRFNTAVFHEEYSEQQSTNFVPTPPFRVTGNIPASTLDGFEVETSAVLPAGFDASLGVGYIEADTVTGKTPFGLSKYSVNLAINQTTQIGVDWELISRADYRRLGSYRTGNDADPFTIIPSDEVNLSTSLRHGAWTASLFVKNLLDHRQATSFVALGAEYFRFVNTPRAYYLELSWRY